jgi:hypothetical protein
MTLLSTGVLLINLKTNCYISGVPDKRFISAITMSTPEKRFKLRRVRITESRKPDIFTTAGKHYFINGVIRVSSPPTFGRYHKPHQR